MSGLAPDAFPEPEYSTTATPVPTIVGANSKKKKRKPKSGWTTNNYKRKRRTYDPVQNRQQRRQEAQRERKRRQRKRKSGEDGDDAAETKEEDEEEEEEQQQKRPLSKKQRKLEKLRAAQERKEREAALFKSLAETQLAPEHQQLMRKTSEIGQKRSQRSRVEEAFLKERAGIDGGDASDLHQTVDVDDDDDEEEEEEDAPVMAAPAMHLPVVSGRRGKRRKRVVILDNTGDDEEKKKKKKKDEEEETDAASLFARLVSHTAADASHSDDDDEEEDEDEEEEEEEVVAQVLPGGVLPNLSTVRVSNNDFVYLPRSESEEHGSRALEKKTKTIIVTRQPSIQEQRLQLPACAKEQEIVEAVGENLVTIIAGATGSGKTTQVPQFLYEAGYTRSDSDPDTDAFLIGVTQPRRVAAVSTCKRVAEELNLQFKSDVAYHIRYDSRVRARTKIKFMTDGILLREIQSDFLLSKYSVIILDEAHERNLNTDVLIGLLSRIVPLRNRLSKERVGPSAPPPLPPLRLVIMSATLRVSDFTEHPHLFAVPPTVLSVEARQHPVTIHFSRRTALCDYEKHVFHKVCQIHTRLPPGAVLVFLTGRHEIERMCKRLREKFARASGTFIAEDALFEAHDKKQQKKEGKEGKEEEGGGGGVATKTSLLAQDICPLTGDVKDGDGGDAGDGDGEGVARAELHPAYDLDDGSDEEGEDSSFSSSDDEDDEDDEEALLTAMAAPVHVLPLYSLLPTKDQLRVFDAVPASHRLIVVATNVAETSLTIHGVKYVVDCGREKRRAFDSVTGASEFVVDWVSQASADQRAGRAGRTGPGHAYRLYSAAVYTDQFARFSTPEILRIPIESTVLQMKTMCIQDVERFPFPTPPDPTAIHKALHMLELLGAVHSQQTADDDDDGGGGGGGDEALHRITPLGRTLALFPVSPRYAKMLVLAHQHSCLQHVITIVSALSVAQLFFTSAPTQEDREALTAARLRWQHPQSDLLSSLRVVGGYLFDQEPVAFCKRNYLRFKSMQELEKLREQLTRISRSVVAADERLRAVVEPQLGGVMKPPTATQETVLRQIIAAGMLDHVARRVSPRDNIVWAERDADAVQAAEARSVLHGDGARAAPKARDGAPGGAAMSAKEEEQARRHDLRGAYESAVTGEPVFVHKDSALYGKDGRVTFIVFHELVRSSKLFMRGCTVVEPAWLFRLGRHLCTVSKPLESPPPAYDADADRVMCSVSVRFGPRRWLLPHQRVEYPAGADRCKQFARLFMEGRVCAPLMQLRPLLAIKPNNLLAPRPSDVASLLLGRFLEGSIDSKAKLVAAWEEDEAFLRREVRLFVQERFRNQVDRIWPPTTLK